MRASSRWIAVFTSTRIAVTAVVCLTLKPPPRPPSPPLPSFCVRLVLPVTCLLPSFPSVLHVGCFASLSTVCLCPLVFFVAVSFRFLFLPTAPHAAHLKCPHKSMYGHHHRHVYCHTVKRPQMAGSLLGCLVASDEPKVSLWAEASASQSTGPGRPCGQPAPESYTPREHQEGYGQGEGVPVLGYNPGFEAESPPRFWSPFGSVGKTTTEGSSSNGKKEHEEEEEPCFALLSFPLFLLLFPGETKEQGRCRYCFVASVQNSSLGCPQLLCVFCSCIRSEYGAAFVAVPAAHHVHQIM